MNNRRVLFFFLFCSVQMFAQESTALKGKILADSLDGSPINIVNLTREIGTINNLKGEFEIEVAQGDTLIFSSVQYEPREILITEEVLKTAFLTVILLEKINELEEVSISNTSLSGNLERDISEVEIFSQADAGFPYPTRPRKTIIERQIYSVASSPLSLLIYTLNGEMKKLKKAKANQDMDFLVHKGMNAIPLTIFIDEFKIPEEEVINFVYFCAEDPAFKSIVHKERPLELIEYYQAKVAFFLENRMGL